MYNKENQDMIFFWFSGLFIWNISWLLSDWTIMSLAAIKVRPSSPSDLYTAQNVAK
jgi:hypothetical protein